MKEKVLEVLNQNDALSMEEIADFIGATTVTSLQELIKVLNELEKEKSLRRVHGGAELTQFE